MVELKQCFAPKCMTYRFGTVDNLQYHLAKEHRLKMTGLAGLAKASLNSIRVRFSLSLSLAHSWSVWNGKGRGGGGYWMSCWIIRKYLSLDIDRNVSFASNFYNIQNSLYLALFVTGWLMVP